MPKQPAPLRPDEPPRPHAPGPDIPPIEHPPHPPQQPDLERVAFSGREPDAPTRNSVRPAARQKAGRRWDRYDYIGAAIVALLVALWAVHFSLPTLPPDNVPDANQPVGRN
jgi:hypothetical protein